MLLQGQIDRQTDGRQTVTLRLRLDAASVMMRSNNTLTVGDQRRHFGLISCRTLGRSHGQSVVEPTSRWTLTDQRPASSN